jgi:hypothetical protein
MILSQLTEAHTTNKAAIIKHLDDCGVSDEDVIIGDDGVVSSTAVTPVIFPKEWSRIPIKFGDFRNAPFHLIGMKLTSFENMPTVVFTLKLDKLLAMTSLRGMPKVRNLLLVEHIELDSLKGITADETLSLLYLNDISRITSLEPLSSIKVEVLRIKECPGLTSLNGIPSGIQALTLYDLRGLAAIRLPKGFTMSGFGHLYVDASGIRKLSPTLIMVEGLREIKHHRNGPVDHFNERILEEFNACLKNPNRKKAFYELQDKLINGLSNFNYNTEYLAEL